MRYCADIGPVVRNETVLFGRERGCAEFEQRLLRFARPSGERANPGDDEVLYALSGTGRATIGDEPAELRPGTAAYVARGTSWRVDAADDLRVLSVLVRDPLPAGAATHAVLDLPDVETAGRAPGGPVP